MQAFYVQANMQMGWHKTLISYESSEKADFSYLFPQKVILETRFIVFKIWRLKTQNQAVFFPPS